MKDRIAFAFSKTRKLLTPELRPDVGRSQPAGVVDQRIRLALSTALLQFWFTFATISYAQTAQFDTDVNPIDTRGKTQQATPAEAPVLSAGAHSLRYSDRKLQALVNERQNAFAALELGNRYFLGADRTPDSTRAVAWWTRAAELGSARAAYNLGVAYLNGLGVDKDIAKAAQLLERAAADKIAAADFALGVMALTGEGRALDYAVAKEHFQRASDRGFAAAKFNLALMYERGVGVERDPERAARLFAAAERQQASDVVSTDVRTAATLPATADTIEAVTAINDHAWIRGQNPKHFTLQLVSGESQTAIADILQTVPGLERAIFSKLLNGQRRFVGIAGNFDTFSAASAAVASLPAPLKNNQPFAVRFEVVQSQIE